MEYDGNLFCVITKSSPNLEPSFSLISGLLLNIMWKLFYNTTILKQYILLSLNDEVLRGFLKL